ncbi:MAG: winged helix-turn-helix domain-containing protein [Candidatus Thiodiazotropha sp.]
MNANKRKYGFFRLPCRGDRTVDTHVKNLRKKLNAVTPDEEIIRSIYGVGYKLELPP